MRACAIEGCGRVHYAKDLCKRHYQRKLIGTPMDLPPQKWGPTVSLVTAHRRPKQLWGPARQYPCVQCGDQAAHWAYDGTDPTQFYAPSANRGGYTWMYSSSYPEFYMPMCAKCHARRDATLAKKELLEYRQWKQRTGLTLADVDKLLEGKHERSAAVSV